MARVACTKFTVGGGALKPGGGRVKSTDGGVLEQTEGGCAKFIA